MSEWRATYSGANVGTDRPTAPLGRFGTPAGRSTVSIHYTGSIECGLTDLVVDHHLVGDSHPLLGLQGPATRLPAATRKALRAPLAAAAAELARALGAAGTL